MSAAGYVVRWFREQECIAVATPKTLRDAMTLLVEPAEDFGEGRVYTVAEDGTETPLPSYEEALAAINSLRAVMMNGAAGDLVEAARLGEEAFDEVVAERNALLAKCSGTHASARGTFETRFVPTPAGFTVYVLGHELTPGGAHRRRATVILCEDGWALTLADRLTGTVRVIDIDVADVAAVFREALSFLSEKGPR